MGKTVTGNICSSRGNRQLASNHKPLAHTTSCRPLKVSHSCLVVQPFEIAVLDQADLPIDLKMLPHDPAFT